MNVSAVLVSTLLAGIIAPAAPAVKICMQMSSANPALVAQAEAKTTQIFADIGVNLEWLHKRRECQRPLEETIVISMSTDPTAIRFPGSMAYALPYEGAHIEVFYDRVLKMVERPRQSTLLAHVLAHEVAHILEGVNRHSGEGIMKANWGERDFMEMSWKPLPFTPEDVLLIRLGMDSRASRLAKR